MLLSFWFSSGLHTSLNRDFGKEGGLGSNGVGAHER
jgi:hypothetical protein